MALTPALLYPYSLTEDNCAFLADLFELDLVSLNPSHQPFFVVQPNEYEDGQDGQYKKRTHPRPSPRRPAH